MRTPSGGTVLSIFKKRRILLYDAQLMLSDKPVSAARLVFTKSFSTSALYVSAPLVMVLAA